MERWRGKIAVVTGASSGIGVATAKQLVQHGFIVIGLARRVDKMKDEMKNARGPGKFHAKECDVSDEKNVTEVFDWIKSTFKSLHVLVNNAAIMNVGRIQDCSTKDIENIFKVNVFGLLYCTKQAIKLMRGSHSEGHIININAILGHRILFPNLSASVYPASKFAVTALSESLRNELTDAKIRVTSISPGAVRTEMFDSAIAMLPQLKQMPALKAEDVADSIIHALAAPPHVEIHEITLLVKSSCE